MTDFYIVDEDKVGLTMFHRDNMDEYLAQIREWMKEWESQDD